MILGAGGADRANGSMITAWDMASRRGQRERVWTVGLQELGVHGQRGRGAEGHRQRNSARGRRKERGGRSADERGAAVSERAGRGTCGLA